MVKQYIALESLLLSDLYQEHNQFASCPSCLYSNNIVRLFGIYSSSMRSDFLVENVSGV